MTVIKHQKEGGRGIGSFLHLNPSLASQDAVGGEGRGGQDWQLPDKRISACTLLLSLRSHSSETGDPDSPLDKAEPGPLLLV